MVFLIWIIVKTISYEECYYINVYIGTNNNLGSEYSQYIFSNLPIVSNLKTIISVLYRCFSQYLNCKSTDKYFTAFL